MKGAISIGDAALEHQDGDETRFSVMDGPKDQQNARGSTRRGQNVGRWKKEAVIAHAARS